MKDVLLQNEEETKDLTHKESEIEFQVSEWQKASRERIQTVAQSSSRKEEGTVII